MSKSCSSSGQMIARMYVPVVLWLSVVICMSDKHISLEMAAAHRVWGLPQALFSQQKKRFLIIVIFGTHPCLSLCLVIVFDSCQMAVYSSHSHSNCVTADFRVDCQLTPQRTRFSIDFQIRVTSFSIKTSMYWLTNELQTLQFDAVIPAESLLSL